MGTIVLPPQDCLLSPHYRQNYHFQSIRPEAGRRCSQALMMPLPAAQDCARHDYSYGSPPGDGLLPIPQSLGQTRAFLTRSPSSKLSSTVCSPPTRKMAAASPSPMMKPKLSRSASAILPTPLAGSPPLVEGDRVHLLKGRLPFKIVQENGRGISTDFAQVNKSKKPVDARNSIHNKMTGRSGLSSNVKFKGLLDGHQGSRSTPKKPHDGASSKGQPKDSDMRNQRKLDRSHSVKGTRDRSQQVEVPVITILQRPKNEEAAAELFAKFFQESAESAKLLQESGEQEMGSRNNDWVEGEELQNSYRMVTESETEQQSIAGGLSDFEASEASLCQTNSIPYIEDHPLPHVLGTVADSVRLTVYSTLVAQSDVEPIASKETVKELEFGCEDLAPWERWAGPSYINSPPPSALPLPKFSRKQLKIESLTTAGFEEIVSDQISTPPLSPLFTNQSGQRQIDFDLDAVATATNDLKRILNLDLCRM